MHYGFPVPFPLPCARAHSYSCTCTESTVLYIINSTTRARRGVPLRWRTVYPLRCISAPASYINDSVYAYGQRSPAQLTGASQKLNSRQVSLEHQTEDYRNNKLYFYYPWQKLEQLQTSRFTRTTSIHHHHCNSKAGNH